MKWSHDGQLTSFIKVIDVPANSGGRVMEVVMSGEQERAIGFLKVPGGDMTESDEED